MDVAVEIRNLKKHFNDRKAVDGITLDIQRGECFGLLGPNGAGKSTLLGMLSGSVEPQDGELFMLGLSIQKSLREIKSRIGVVPQSESLDPELTVAENLRVFGSYFGNSGLTLANRVQELLRLVALDDRTDERVDTLSGGLRRRLSIVRALLNEPEILVLDEPTVGLDPQARFWIWDFLRKKQKEKITQILTTHYMEEAEALCDRVGLINKGKLLDVGTPKEIIQRHWGHEVVEFLVTGSESPFYLANRLKEKGFSYQLLGSRFLVALTEKQKGQDVISLIQSPRVTLRKPDLNDVFLKLTGSDLNQEESHGLE